MSYTPLSERDDGALYAPEDERDIYDRGVQTATHRRPGERSQFGFGPADTRRGTMILIRDPFTTTSNASGTGPKLRLLIRIDDTDRNAPSGTGPVAREKKAYQTADEEGIWVGTSGQQRRGSVKVNLTRQDWNGSIAERHIDLWKNNQTYADPWKLISLKNYEIPAGIYPNGAKVGRVKSEGSRRALSQIKAGLDDIIAGDPPFGP